MIFWINHHNNIALKLSHAGFNSWIIFLIVQSPTLPRALFRKFSPTVAGQQWRRQPFKHVIVAATIVATYTITKTTHHGTRNPRTYPRQAQPHLRSEFGRQKRFPATGNDAQSRPASVRLSRPFSGRCFGGGAQRRPTWIPATLAARQPPTPGQLPPVSLAVVPPRQDIPPSVSWRYVYTTPFNVMIGSLNAFFM